MQEELTPEQCLRLSCLLELIDGFQSALSLEVLATVDFVQKADPTITHQNTVEIIHEWPGRKSKLFREEYIRIVSKHLEAYRSQLNILGTTTNFVGST